MARSKAIPRLLSIPHLAAFRASGTSKHLARGSDAASTTWNPRDAGDEPENDADRPRVGARAQGTALDGGRRGTVLRAAAHHRGSAERRAQVERRQEVSRGGPAI